MTFVFFVFGRKCLIRSSENFETVKIKSDTKFNPESFHVGFSPLYQTKIKLACLSN